ncbi:MAG: YggS family pyridoxal phosphate-dependent enzyme [Planctomycetota bacterium]
MAGESALMRRREQIIADNLLEVRGRMERAAARAGRTGDSVRLVAVTKYATLDDIRALLAAGASDLGENRPQQLWQRAESLHAELSRVETPRVAVEPRWHLVGHWQRNKVERALPWIHCLHSGDSLRLLEAASHAVIQRQVNAGEPHQSALDVLLEVYISGDANKHGFAPHELEPLLPRLAQLGGIRVRGLMSMSGLESDTDDERRQFAATRQLRDRLASVSPPELSWSELSMGMSGDFEIAIEEGATWVRVGSSLLAGLEGCEA